LYFSELKLYLLYS